MTTIKPTPERTYTKIRGKSFAVDEDILRQVVYDTGISKNILRYKFEKPNFKKNSLDYGKELYDKMFKIVLRDIKKNFPDGPDDPDFDLQSRIQLLTSIGEQGDFTLLNRSDIRHDTLANILEESVVPKYQFHSNDYDRAGRVLIKSFPYTNKNTPNAHFYVVVLLDESIKKMHGEVKEIYWEGVAEKYFILDFHRTVAKLYLRKMIIDFTLNRPDLAKYAILDLYTESRKTYVKSIDDDSDANFKRILSDFAVSQGYEVVDSHIGETFHSLGYMERIFKGLPLQLTDKDYLNNSFRDELFIILTKEFIRYVNALQEKIKNLSINRSEYARAYEMKKGQKSMHIERASNSRLLKYFDEIEFDGDVKIDRFKDFEEDLIEMLNGAKFPKIEGSSLRLRKLGRHHATGMYFIEPKAVVIDFRKNGLKSCLHELLHHLDYTYRKTRQEGLETLHDSLAFRELYDMYHRRIEKTMVSINTRIENGDAGEEEKDFHSEWNGNTKYNNAYYLREEEVFARLGEIALLDELKNRGLEPTLYKTEKDMHKGVSQIVVYPIDDALVDRATEYFKQTLPFLFSQTKG
ncbi:hypothetical protein [Exiguobacterium artemiae]|uniref:hypothetical protein n=1 Tax=Exiguobacterium artemiae TaxID=340145 RepID=UPI002964CFE0|nr:hypothetical protein [Exiguobacterium sibiricum]MDW2886672.1 hypothetical protein [Exiguobacterium sibiricum]